MMKRPIVVPIGPSIAYVELTRGQFSLIDTEDVEELSGYNWFANWSRFTLSFYAVRQETIGKGKQRSKSIHASLLRVPKGKLVDHVNRNSLDNRRCNLRSATVSENALNRRPSSRAIPRGIVWHKQSQRWEARAARDGKRIYLGRFRKIEDAVAAREDYDKERNGWSSLRINP